MTDYDAIYRRLHPRSHPFSPHERQRELRDLWPCDQKGFRDMVDTVMQTEGEVAAPKFKDRGKPLSKY